MVGTTISHYKILEKIGEGGMGDVYRATDTKLNRDVALKILPERFASDSQRMARFQREAEVLASLDHPNIGQIYGIEEAGQTKALVLQLIEGPTLADKIAQGPIPVEDALKIALQMAEGLEAAHEKGVIHRDLKPANIKITPEGQVKILDFGLAKALEGETPPNTNLSQSPTLTAAATQAGVILGTAAYMSPEQAKGQAVDKRADIFAFGAVLYECLTGKRAFEAETISETIARVLMANPDWKGVSANIPWRIQDLLRKCLQKDPRRRKQSIADVRVEVEELAQTPMVETGERQPESPGGKRVAVTGMVAGIVLGVVVTFALLALRSDSSTTEDSVSRFPIPLPAEVANTEVFLNFPSSMVAISPDGSRLAVIGGPSHALHVRELAELSFRQLPGTTGARNPFFSPDGNQVAFFTKGTNELKVVSLVAGSQPQTLLDGVPNSDWAYGSWGENDVLVFSTFDSGLFLASARDPVMQTLTTPVGIFHNYPKILPGSEAVVFNTQEDETTTIQVLDLSSPDAAPQTLFSNASHPHYLASGHLLFAREGNLWVAPFDTATLSAGSPVSVPIAVIFDNPMAHDPVPQLAVSLTGTLVYAAGQGAKRRSGRLVWVDRTGNVVDDLGPVPGGMPALQLSPDQTKLALEYRDGSDVLVSIFDMSRGINESVVVTKRQNFRGMPVWKTPDADQLILSRTGIVEGTMFLQGAIGDTGNSELFTTQGSMLFPLSLSSDGMRLLYNFDAPKTSTDIGVYEFGENSGEGELHVVVGTPAQEGTPSWSPDGRTIAYVVGSLGEKEVYVQPYPTGRAVQVSPNGGFGPLWSPDGTELFYQRDEGKELWAAPIATDPEIRPGEARMLFEGSYQMSGNGGFTYDVSNDGQRFLMVQTDPDEWIVKELVVVLNWFEELKRLVPTDN